MAKRSKGAVERPHSGAGSSIGTWKCHGQLHLRESTDEIELRYWSGRWLLTAIMIIAWLACSILMLGGMIAAVQEGHMGHFALAAGLLLLPTGIFGLVLVAVAGHQQIILKPDGITYCFRLLGVPMTRQFRTLDQIVSIAAIHQDFGPEDSSGFYAIVIQSSGGAWAIGHADSHDEAELIARRLDAVWKAFRGV